MPLKASPYPQTRAWMETTEGVTAVLAAITAARESDPTIQWCVEQPATGGMQHLQTVQETLGLGTVVAGLIHSLCYRVLLLNR
jgi:hypothetical protein